MINSVDLFQLEICERHDCDRLFRLGRKISFFYQHRKKKEKREIRKVLCIEKGTMVPGTKEMFSLHCESWRQRSCGEQSLGADDRNTIGLSVPRDCECMRVARAAQLLTRLVTWSAVVCNRHKSAHGARCACVWYVLACTMLGAGV